MKKINWFLFLLFLCATPQLRAQNALTTESIDEEISGEHLIATNSFSNFYTPFPTDTLGEIVVTGTGTPHDLKDAPVQTELINNKLLKSTATTSFSDLMSSISPSFDFSPSAMGSFMQLNGLGNDFILVMIDGKRTYGDMGGQSDLNRISLSNIDHIEIVKGASSALYGSDAIAGTINIITKKSKNKLELANNTRIGGFGEWIQHNSLDFKKERFSSSTTFDRKTSDGWQVSKYEISGDELIETDAMTQNPFTDYTINQSFSYTPIEKLSFSLQGSKYQREVNRPLTVSAYDFFFDDFSYSAGGKYLLKKENYLQADWSSDAYKYYYKYNQTSGDYVANDKQIQTDQLRYSLNLKGVFHLSKNHLLSIGGEYANEKLESSGRLTGNNADAFTLAAYAQDEMEIAKNLSVVLGARYVNHKTFGNAFTPKVSAKYDLHNFNFRATYAKGYKAPTLKELYYHYQKSSTLYLGNAELDPETSNYYSFSTEYTVKQFSFSLTAYENKINDLIDYQIVETSDEDADNGVKVTKEHYNISKAGTQGIDFLFNVTLGSGIYVGGGYSFVNARNKTENIRLEGVAENYGNLRVGYNHTWNKYTLNTNLSARIQDEKYYEDGNAKGYNLWKFTTIHHFKTIKAFDLELTAGIDNIFDYVDASPYGSNYGTINPGRTIFAGLNIVFAVSKKRNHLNKL